MSVTLIPVTLIPAPYAPSHRRERGHVVVRACLRLRTVVGRVLSYE